MHQLNGTSLDLELERYKFTYINQIILVKGSHVNPLFSPSILIWVEELILLAME